MVSRKDRSSNLELFRIITMFFIILHHYVVNSGLTEVISSDPLSWRSLTLLLFGAWGKTGINCFVIITGYFMCKSNITARKFVKLLGEVMFYRIIIYCIFLFSGYEAFSIKSFIEMIIPITSIDKDFTSCYLIFFLVIPFINRLIHNLTEKQHIYLLALCSFAYVIIGTVHRITFNYASWFIVLYFIGSYIRLYPKKTFTSARFWGFATTISILLLAASVVICTWIKVKTGRGYSYSFAYDSNSLLPAIIGISSFLLFKNLNIKHNNLINTIAASTFGVFCIHANSNTMRKWLWRDVLDNVGHYSSPLIPLHALVSVSVIFIVCIIIDKIRILLIEKPFFQLWDRNWSKIEKWYRGKEAVFFNKYNIESDKENKI